MFREVRNMPYYLNMLYMITEFCETQLLKMIRKRINNYARIKIEHPSKTAETSERAKKRVI
jgi:hypothetical protein